jgi:putative peptidoglycan lipid II flippase
VSNTLASSGRISAAVFASRILGLVREVIFATLFGAGAVADAYQVAFRVPNMLRDLFAEGALSSAFIPNRWWRREPWPPFNRLERRR